MRELAAEPPEGEKKAVDYKIFSFLRCKSGLSLRQNLRFCHLPPQREAKVRHKIIALCLTGNQKACTGRGSR